MEPVGFLRQVVVTRRSLVMTKDGGGRRGDTRGLEIGQSKLGGGASRMHVDLQGMCSRIEGSIQSP